MCFQARAQQSGFTSLERQRGSNRIIFRHNKRKVNGRNAVFMLQKESTRNGMYLFGQQRGGALLDDV